MMCSFKISKKMHCVGVAVFAAVAFFQPASSLRAELIDPDAFILDFNENFDWLDVSARGPGTRWTAHTPWNGDFGDAKFTDPGPDFPFTVKNGVLKIEARKSADGQWKSGLLASTDGNGDGFKQRDGYFEMRARFPAGDGVWPAFWLTSRGAEKAIEVDVVEHYGHAPDRYSASLHIWDRKTPALSKSFHQSVPVVTGALSSDFHTYGVAVQEDRIKYFLDRKEVWSIETPRELEHPFTILIDLGLGAGWPIDKTPSPSIMEVDYVRVWSLPPD